MIHNDPQNHVTVTSNWFWSLLSCPCNSRSHQRRGSSNLRASLQRPLFAHAWMVPPKPHVASVNEVYLSWCSCHDDHLGDLSWSFELFLGGRDLFPIAIDLMCLLGGNPELFLPMSRPPTVDSGRLPIRLMVYLTAWHIEQFKRKYVMIWC